MMDHDGLASARLSHHQHVASLKPVKRQKRESWRYYGVVKQRGGDVAVPLQGGLNRARSADFV